MIHPGQVSLFNSSSAIRDNSRYHSNFNGLKTGGFMTQKRRIERMLEKQEEKLRRRIDSGGLALRPRTTLQCYDEECAGNDENPTRGSSTPSLDDSFASESDPVNPAYKSTCIKTPRPGTPLPMCVGGIVNFSTPPNTLHSRSSSDSEMTMSSNRRQFASDHTNSLHSRKFYERGTWDSGKLGSKSPAVTSYHENLFDEISEKEQVASRDNHPVIFDDTDGVNSNSLISWPQDLDKIPKNFVDWFCCELTNENRCLLVYELMEETGTPVISATMLNNNSNGNGCDNDNDVGNHFCQRGAIWNTQDNPRKFFSQNTRGIEMGRDDGGAFRPANEQMDEMSSSENLEISFLDDSPTQARRSSTSKINLRSLELIPSGPGNSEDKDNSFEFFGGVDAAPANYPFTDTDTDEEVSRRVSNAAMANNNMGINAPTDFDFFGVQREDRPYSQANNEENSAKQQWSANGSGSGSFGPLKSKSEAAIGWSCLDPIGDLKDAPDGTPLSSGSGKGGGLFIGRFDTQSGNGIKFRDISIDPAAESRLTNIKARKIISRGSNNMRQEMVYNYLNGEGQERAKATLMFPDGSPPIQFNIVRIPGVKRAILDGVFDCTRDVFTATDILKLEYTAEWQSQNATSWDAMFNANVMGSGKPNKSKREIMLNTGAFQMGNNFNRPISSSADSVTAREERLCHFHIEGINDNGADKEDGRVNGSPLNISAVRTTSNHTGVNSFGDTGASATHMVNGSVVSQVLNSQTTECLSGKPYSFRFSVLNKLLESSQIIEGLTPTQNTTEHEEMAMAYHGGGSSLHETGETSELSPSLRSLPSAFKSSKTKGESDVELDKPTISTPGLWGTEGCYPLHKGESYDTVTDETSSHWKCRGLEYQTLCHTRTRSLGTFTHSDATPTPFSSTGGVTKRQASEGDGGVGLRNWGWGASDAIDHRLGCANSSLVPTGTTDKQAQFTITSLSSPTGKDNKEMDEADEVGGIGGMRRVGPEWSNDARGLPTISIELPTMYLVNSVSFRILMNRIADAGAGSAMEAGNNMLARDELPVVYFYDPDAVYRPGMSESLLRWKFRE